MTNPIPAPIKVVARVLLLCAPALMLAGCLQPQPGGMTVGVVTSDQAMSRANAAYSLAQQAEADAQAARAAASTMYQRSMYK